MEPAAVEIDGSVMEGVSTKVAHLFDRRVKTALSFRVMLTC